MWRLGRRQYVLCADPEDPCEDWADRRLVREDATRSQTFDVPLAYLVLHTGSSVCVSLTRDGDSRWRTD